MLLDHLDELPLRRHEIRGNPAGLLARLLERIDALKAGGADEPRRAARARARRRRRGGPRDARREPELAELCAAHDRILAEAGQHRPRRPLPHPRPAAARAPDVRAALAARFTHLMVDEFEEATAGPAGAPRRAGGRQPEPALRARGRPDERARRPGPAPPSRWRRGRARAPLPRPQLRFWRCANERAQAQAVARDVEHLLAAGTSPEEICVLVEDPAAKGGAGRGGDGGARHPLPPRRARPRSSSAPRCATRSPGCGCSPTPATRPPRRAR